MSPPVLTVAGIGSRHSTDDAIGLRLVASLDRLPTGVRCELWEDSDALDLARRLLDNGGPLLIVDCAEMNLAAGEWRCFAGEPASNMKLTLHSRSISTHGLGLAEALAIARRLGLTSAVSIFAVQPYELALCPPTENPLSEAMQARLPRLLAALRNNIDTLRTRMPQEA